MTAKSKRHVSPSRLTVAKRNALAAAELQRLANRDPVVKLRMRLGWLHSVSKGFSAAKALDDSDECAESRLAACDIEENAIEEILTITPAKSKLGARIQLRLADVLLWCLAEPGPALDVPATVHKVRRLVISAYRALDDVDRLTVEELCLQGRLPHPLWPFPQEYDMEQAARRIKALDAKQEAEAAKQEGGAS